MPDNRDSLSGVFEEVLSTLEHVLSVDQIRELRHVIDYEEHDLALEMLIAMFRQAKAAVPHETSALFLRLARQLRVDAALWRDVYELNEPGR